MTITDHDENEAKPDVGTSPKPAGRLTRRRPATPATPAARFELGRVAEPRHGNPIWLVAGILLVLLSALGGVLLFTSNDDRVEVLVAASDLEPGQPIAQSDLRIERVALDGGVSSMEPSTARQLVGQLPVGRVPAGTMLTAGMFAAELPLGADEMVVGAALDPGEAPLSGLEIGAQVQLLVVSIPGPGDAPTPEEDAGPGTGVVADASPIGDGTVWAVEQIATGQTWVSLRVPSDVGLAASAASAGDRLRIVLIGGAG